MQVSSSVIRGRKVFSLMVERSERRVDSLVRLLCPLRTLPNSMGYEYLLSEADYEVFKLLVDNNFSVIDLKDGMVCREPFYPTSSQIIPVDQALRNIQNGDYIVDNFLDTVDGKI